MSKTAIKALDTDKTFDLADLNLTVAANRGTRIELKHPITAKPLGIFVTVVGKESDTFKAAVRENINDRIARDHMARKRGKDIAPPTVEEGEAEAIDLLILCTTAWENMRMGGELLEFNVPNGRKVYKDYPWIRKQVDDAIGDLELFTTT